MFVCIRFFLKIRLGLTQFLFEVNRTSISGEILKKPCARTQISEKSCFR